jgi:hypothetical protein
MNWHFPVLQAATLTCRALSTVVDTDLLLVRGIEEVIPLYGLMKLLREVMK